MKRSVLIAGVVAGAIVCGSVGTAAPARDGGEERAEVLLFGTALDRFVAKQLPATIAVHGDRDAGIDEQTVTMVDARSCAATDASHGRFVGVVRPQGASAAGLASLEPSDCRGKMDDVAKRLAAPSDAGAVAVVELIVESTASALRVSVGDVATSGDGARPLARTLARARAAGALAALETSGLRLETERGSTLTLDLAVTFPKGADGVLATLTVGCAGCAPAAVRAPFLTRPAASADADGVAGATLRFANRVVGLFNDDGPLVLRFDRQTVEIRKIQISGGEGTLTVRGRATSPVVSETALVSIESSGSDLRLAEVRAEAELEDCAGLSGGASLRCTLRNAARAPAAAALAAAMTSQYRGKLLRTLVAPPPLTFELGGRRMTLRLAPTRASASAGNLIVYGKAELE
jgi:hypothetical protein